MRILKNSKEILDHLKFLNSNHKTSIKAFDFLTLYIPFPHKKLKSRFASITRNSFIFKNGNSRYRYFVLVTKRHILWRNSLDPRSKYSEDDIMKVFEFLVDNIFVGFVANRRHLNVTKLRPSSTRHLSLILQSGIIQSLLSTGKKQ